MNRASTVVLERFAEKQLRKVPRNIQEAFLIWVSTVEKEGVRGMRRLPGYHDEPLKGRREGERSARLSRAYRVIYREHASGEIEVITVQEVNKHEY